MLEHDVEDSCIGKVNFVRKEEEPDFFDTAMPTENSWQFTITDSAEDIDKPEWRVVVHLDKGGVTPDNVFTVIPEMWRGMHRPFHSPAEAIEHLVSVEKDREAFNRQNSEACRNALAAHAKQSKWWTGCLPFGEKNDRRIAELMGHVEETLKFFREAKAEGNETKTALFATLVADGYTLSEALESVPAALSN